MWGSDNEPTEGRTPTCGQYWSTDQRIHIREPLPVLCSQAKLQLEFTASVMPEPPRTAFDATGHQVVLLLLATGLLVAWMESFTEQEKPRKLIPTKKLHFLNRSQENNYVNSTDSRCH